MNFSQGENWGIAGEQAFTQAMELLRALDDLRNEHPDAPCYTLEQRACSAFAARLFCHYLGKQGWYAVDQRKPKRNEHWFSIWRPEAALQTLDLLQAEFDELLAKVLQTAPDNRTQLAPRFADWAAQSRACGANIWAPDSSRKSRFFSNTRTELNACRAKIEMVTG